MVDANLILLRGSFERSKNISEVLLYLFSTKEDLVIDLLAGVENMAIACTQMERHCVSIDIDSAVHDASLRHIGEQWYEETFTRSKNPPWDDRMFSSSQHIARNF